eukprot:Plantae.Rhodophyta-Hildenbrandia_rubra.ctg9027.p1 GENE.Plantae.Rhodophyta-Hildenbrandia_rubra.ctg9027~~Plantae.Rhodophyta-Hildenbrandia_rubra.ctg9027.p1  ORF type:complete len:1009 (+),score=146.18 Plantae.Rhodophyta-Hildenbrandia_rubra.ctg9027:2400-5426(+)
METIRADFEKALRGHGDALDPTIRLDKPEVFTVHSNESPRLRIDGIGNIDFPIVGGMIRRAIRARTLSRRTLHMQNDGWVGHVTAQALQKLLEKLEKKVECTFSLELAGFVLVYGGRRQEKIFESLEEQEESRRALEEGNDTRERWGTMFIELPTRSQGGNLKFSHKQSVVSKASEYDVPKWTELVPGSLPCSIMQGRLNSMMYNGVTSGPDSESERSVLVFQILVASKHEVKPDIDGLYKVIERWSGLTEGSKYLLYILDYVPNPPLNLDVHAFSQSDAKVLRVLREIESQGVIDLSLDVMTNTFTDKMCEGMKKSTFICSESYAWRYSEYPMSVSKYGERTRGDREAKYQFTPARFLAVPEIHQRWIRRYDGDLYSSKWRKTVLWIYPKSLRLSEDHFPELTSTQMFSDLTSLLCYEKKPEFLESLRTRAVLSLLKSRAFKEFLPKASDLHAYSVFLSSVRGHYKEAELVGAIISIAQRHPLTIDKEELRQRALMMNTLYDMLGPQTVLRSLQHQCLSLIVESSASSLTMALSLISIMFRKQGDKIPPRNEEVALGCTKIFLHILFASEDGKAIRKTGTSQLELECIPVQAIGTLILILVELKLASDLSHVIELYKEKLLGVPEWSLDVAQRIKDSKLMREEDLTALVNDVFTRLRQLNNGLVAKIGFVVETIGIPRSTPTLIKLVQRGGVNITGQVLELLLQRMVIVESSYWPGLRKKLIEFYVSDFSHRRTTESVVNVFRLCLKAGATDELYEEAIANLAHSLETADISHVASAVRAVKQLVKEASGSLFVECLAVALAPRLRRLRNTGRRHVEKVTSPYCVGVQTHKNKRCIAPHVDAEVQVVNDYMKPVNAMFEQRPRLGSKSSFCGVCSSLQQFLDDPSQKVYRISGSKRAHSQNIAQMFEYAGDIRVAVDRGSSNIQLLLHKLGTRATQPPEVVEGARKTLKDVIETIEELKKVSPRAKKEFLPSFVPLIDLTAERPTVELGGPAKRRKKDPIKATIVLD